MDFQYTEHYQLMEEIASNPQIIESPVLYNFDDLQMYAALMDRMATDNIDGSPSPLSSRSPGSAHARLAEAVIHQQSLLAHEINLMSYFVWLQVYRMLGIEIAPAEYPVINLVFTKTLGSVNTVFKAQIPAGTEIRSAFDSSFVAYTIEDAEIADNDSSVNVPARLNRAGRIPDLQIGEFSDLPRLLPFIESVTNDGVVYNQGRERETLKEAMLRTREELRTGRRCVTLSDYANCATSVAGAKKCNVIRGSQYGIPGRFDDLITVVVYPEEMTPVVDSIVRPRSLANGRLDIRPAEIIPIDGSISIRILPSLTDEEAFDLAASAIAEKINPPGGKWQDNNFAATLAEALELVEGIYAVPEINLQHAFTGVPLERIIVEPWHLFEIRSSLSVNILRK